MPSSIVFVRVGEEAPVKKIRRIQYIEKREMMDFPKNFYTTTKNLIGRSFDTMK